MKQSREQKLVYLYLRPPWGLFTLKYETKLDEIGLFNIG